MTPKFKIGDKVVLSDGYTVVVQSVGICYTMESRYSLYSEDSLKLYEEPTVESKVSCPLIDPRLPIITSDTQEPLLTLPALTKREYAAIQIFTGMSDSFYGPKQRAAQAVLEADILLEALEL